MEKPSGSEHKQGLVPIPTVARINIQKATTPKIHNNNPAKSTQKLRNITEQNCSSSQIQSLNLSTRTQPLSQATMDQLEIDDPLASCNNVLDQLTQIWENVDTNSGQVFSSNDMKTEMAKVDARLEQANVKIDKLKAKFHTIQKNNEALRKFIDGEAKTRKELIEKQNISENRRLLIGDQIVAIKDILKGHQESNDQLKQMCDLILKQGEEVEDLKKKVTGSLVTSKEEKDLEDQIALTEKAISQVQIKYQHLQKQFTEISQNVNKKSCKREELKKTMCKNQEIHDKEVEKLSHTIKNIDAKLNTEREENSKLLIRNNESSKKLRELLTEYQALQGSNTENAKQIQGLKFNIQELKEKQENLKSKMEELKSTNLAVTSERDLELADYRKQLQDLTLEYTETTNKLIEITSNNEKLSDTLIAKKIQRDEELKKASSNKDDKLTDLKSNLNDAELMNEKLSAEAQSLDEKLIGQKNLLSQINADLKTSNAKENENSQRESELGTRLATAKQNLEKKIATIAELRNVISTGKSSSLKERKKFERDIEQKNKQINELRKIRENRQKEKERIGSENDKKLQKMTQLSMECQRAGHETQIKERTVKIDILKQQISAEKLKVKQENIDKPDGKKKEQREAHLNEIKSDIDDIEKVISETKEQQKDLRATLKKAEIVNETKDSAVQESLNSSSLLGIMYGKSESKPASSTPEHSPQRENFVNDSFSDVSSIIGSDIFEDAERRYSQYLENNKTDNAKLNQPDRTDKFDEMKRY